MEQDKFFRQLGLMSVRFFLIANLWLFFGALPLAYTQSAAGTAEQVKVQDILKFKIPANWGVVRDVYDAGTNKLIINIQDAHCDFTAQKNISHILDSLVKNYKLQLVALEGAAGKVSNPVLSGFPDQDIRKMAALHLMHTGKLTGAEYLAANSDYGLELYGAEDISLYLENLKAFQESRAFQQEAGQYFKVLNKALDLLKVHIYNQQLHDFDALKQKYNLKQISFSQYAQAIADLIQTNYLGKVNYPTFFELQRAIEMETKVDFKQADKERTNLITALTNAITNKKDIVALLDKSLEFKKGTLSPGTYAKFLKDLCFKIRLTLAPYPAFCVYADYICKYEAVANETLFKEIKKIEDDLKTKFYTLDSQKTLDDLYLYLSLLKKLVNMDMLSEDIDYFFAHRSEINTETFRKFISEQALEHNLSIKLPQQLSYIDVYLPVWAKFYELADQRDLALIENTLEKMDSTERNFSVLITGGFHTEKMIEFLKTKNISYLVITPRIKDNDSNPYFNLLEGGKTMLEEFVGNTLSP